MRLTTLTIAFSILAANRAEAQVGDSTTVLGTIVVTATKSPVEKSSLSQSVTTITGEELRARGVARVSDALRSVAGAAVVQNGSNGSVNTLFMRGGESRYTKVLIDGVAVNAPGGFFDFSHLTTDNVDRIEIVRGATGVVHGADAVSGVIQIFTRQGGGPASLSAEARAGSYGSREAALSTSGSAGRARFSIAGSARHTDGIFDFNNQYYNGTLSGSAGFAPREGTDITVSTRYGAAEFHYPTDFTGAPVDSNAYRVQHRLTVGVSANARILGRLMSRLRLGTNEVSDLTEDINIPFGATDPVNSRQLARNKRRSAELGLSAPALFGSTVDAGLEYIDESERSDGEDGPVGGASIPTSAFSASRHTRAAYAELNAPVGGASLTLGGRVDDNSEYDTHATWRAGASIPLAASTRVRASFSTAFNAPAFNQIRPTLFTLGSPGLEPERARSWEVGAEQSLADGRVTVGGSYFRQRFMNMIQFVPGGPPDFLGSFDNLTEAESNGVESEITVSTSAGWSANASYTVAEPRVRRVSEDYGGDLQAGDALIRRPTHSGNATVSWMKRGVASVSTSAMYVGRRPDLDFTQFPSPTVTLPSYVRIDAAGSLDVLRLASGRSSVALTARVENLLDREYEDVLNFATPGRTILIGARYSGSL
jgi:vitamin B12 transporter